MHAAEKLGSRTTGSRAGGCFAQVTLKVAHTSGGKFEFWPVFLDVGPRWFGLLCAGMGYGSQYHRGMALAGSPRLFSTPFSYYTHPCGKRVVRARARALLAARPWPVYRAPRIPDFVLLDRSKSHEISMLTPIRVHGARNYAAGFRRAG